MNLVDLGGAQDDGADIGVLGGPGQSKLTGSATEPLGHGGELPNLLDLGLAFGLLELLDGVLEESLVVGEARILGNAVIVLASQETRGERAPDSGAVLELLEQRLVLDFEALAVEGVVLGLLDNGGNEVVFLGNQGSLSDLGSAPLGSAWAIDLA